MSFVQQHHAETTLTDTATNREWQLIVQQLLVEIQFLALFLIFYGQLAQQTLLIDTYTHGRELERASQYRIPDQDIAIQTSQTVLAYCRPVIIVWCTTVVLLAIRQLATNTNHEDSAILLADGILALFRCLVRIHLEQFFSMNEVNLLRQERFDLRISLASQIFRTTNGGIDTLHHILQEADGTLFLGNHGLPVPLVNIQ